MHKEMGAIPIDLRQGWFFLKYWEPQNIFTASSQVKSIPHLGRKRSHLPAIQDVRLGPCSNDSMLEGSVVEASIHSRFLGKI